MCGTVSVECRLAGRPRTCPRIALLLCRLTDGCLPFVSSRRRGCPCAGIEHNSLRVLAGGHVGGDPPPGPQDDPARLPLNVPGRRGRHGGGTGSPRTCRNSSLRLDVKFSMNHSVLRWSFFRAAG